MQRQALELRETLSPGCAIAVVTEGSPYREKLSKNRRTALRALRPSFQAVSRSAWTPDTVAGLPGLWGASSVRLLGHREPLHRPFLPAGLR